MEIQVIGRRLAVDVDDDGVLAWIREYWDFPETAGGLAAGYSIDLAVGRPAGIPDLILGDPDEGATGSCYSAGYRTLWAPSQPLRWWVAPWRL